MTVDVEEYFQVAAFESVISPSRWEEYPSRLEYATGKILDLLAPGAIHATFFVLGWVARRHPGLIRRIVAEGHELASHGMAHVRVWRQTGEVFYADARDSRLLLEDVGGVPVTGYRASTYSIGKENPWAFERLAEAGYRYSSSVYPIRHDLYGWPEAPRTPFWPSGVPGSGVVEIPVATLQLGGRRIPCGGGGFFRLYPYALSRWAWRRLNEGEGIPGVFYFHPWELDPEQPRIRGIGLKTRFRHYLHLGRMTGRIAAWLRDGRWDRMDRVFAPLLG
ncbi:MAG: DUF3473 domain-containing protein, partial [Magnetococcales bacterium]|nr:DUF3473 domain-containing protein [Magnetococcales bacterium]